MFACEYVLFQLILQRFQGLLSVWSERTEASSLKNKLLLLLLLLLLGGGGFTPIPMLSLVMCSNYPRS